MRRYQEAAALLARAARQAPNAAAFLARAEALGRARRHEQVALPAGDPASVAQRFLLAALDDTTAAQTLGGMWELLSRGLAESLTPAARAELVEAPGRDERIRRASSPGAALAADVRQDLALAAWRAAVQGDDQTGYRVELTSAVGESPGRVACFVVRESGEYRIAGVGDAPATLAFEALRRLAAQDLRGAAQWLDWAGMELQDPRPPAPETADPAGVGAELPSVPLLALWRQAAPRGDQATIASAAGEEIRCAAASLAATGTGLAGAAAGEATVTVLRSCRDRADGARRLALEVALALAHGGMGRFQEMLASARALTAARPDSPLAFALQARALAGLARWEELAALAEGRLQIHPEDVAALRIAAHAASRRGDLDGAAARLRRIVDGGRESAGDLNQLAWLALVRGRPDDQAVEDAQRAAALSGYRDAAALHTLASLYVERGRPAEAYRIILQSIAARPAGAAAQPAEPEAADWYVFGHLAESYGLPEVARRLYARVRPGKLEELDPLSTFRLAQARLAALGGVKEAATAKGGRDVQ